MISVGIYHDIVSNTRLYLFLTKRHCSHDPPDVSGERTTMVPKCFRYDRSRLARSLVLQTDREEEKMFHDIKARANALGIINLGQIKLH